MFVPVPGNIIYSQYKAYCTTSLPSFIQKDAKIGDHEHQHKALEYVSYIYNNLPTKQGSTQKSQCIM
jgi:hypothetical protein